MTERDWVGSATPTADLPKNWDPAGILSQDDVLHIRHGLIIVNPTAELPAPLHISSNVTLSDIPHIRLDAGEVSLLADGWNPPNTAVILIYKAANMELDALGNATLHVQSGTWPLDAKINIEPYSDLKLGINTVGGDVERYTISGQSSTSSSISFLASSVANAAVSIDAEVDAGDIVRLSGSDHPTSMSFIGAQKNLAHLELDGDPTARQPVLVDLEHPNDFFGQIDLNDGQIDLHPVTPVVHYNLSNGIFSGYGADGSTLFAFGFRASGFNVTQNKGVFTILDHAAGARTDQPVLGPLLTDPVAV
jgi:hypothetical protein